MGCSAPGCKSAFVKLKKVTLELTTILAVLVTFIVAGSALPGGVAQAATAGRVCMFNAPSGVFSLGGVDLIGHVGWAFRNGTGDNWTFGATEGTPGGRHADPGQDNQSWQDTGPWTKALYAFGSGQHYDKGGNYYTTYRCADVSNSQHMLAYNQALTGAASGYDLLTNNCLTQAVDIFRAYGVTGLPPAAKKMPNTYYNSSLPSSFGGVQWLETYLTLNVLLDDPQDHTPVNTNPLHKTRPLHVMIYDANNQLGFEQWNVTANAVTGTDKYNARILLPRSWPGGVYAPAYMVKVQLDYTLRKYVPGIVLIQHGVENLGMDTPITIGDVNQDNSVTNADYNLMMQCYSDLLPPPGPCDSSLKRASDLNDDSLVNQLDYNLYLRVVMNSGGG